MAADTSRVLQSDVTSTLMCGHLKMAELKCHSGYDFTNKHDLLLPIAETSPAFLSFTYKVVTIPFLCDTKKAAKLQVAFFCIYYIGSLASIKAFIPNPQKWHFTQL